ncbi:MAG: hypothetical protein JST49_09485 [Bacteroidetes bacterium]|nr:hypothetical protein [Bacteroidota bacterium]
MNKKLLTIAAFAVLFALVVVTGCKKDPDPEPSEPIQLVAPDSSIIRHFPEDVMDYEFNFTTDRPLNWVKGMYDYDTTGVAGHVATYPDTLFFVALDTLDPRVNLYNYKGSFTIPGDSFISPYDVIRFKISFEAGSTTFKPGQNYPAGIVSATKEFRVDIR